MSLSKKLWVIIGIIMVMAFVGTFAISTLSAQRYFSEQLHVKNVDSAASLALSMSQVDKDPVFIELMLAAKFDTGHYKLIKLTAPNGEVMVERHQSRNLDKVPGWFARLIPVSAEPGVAQVQDQWKQFGTLVVESHEGYAYVELWNSTLRLLGWFVIAALLTGMLGSSLLRLILSPLNAVIGQAEAIGEQRFITTAEPSTTEFRRLVRVMNTLSGRVRKMLQEESQRVEELRKQAQLDPVSGINKRDSLLNALDARLSEQHSAHSSGMLVVLRIRNLADLNQAMGRQTTDQLIHLIGMGLQSIVQKHSHWTAGRLNGSDFAVITPSVVDTEAVCNRLHSAMLDAWPPSIEGLSEMKVHVGGCLFKAGESASAVLSRADGALAMSESQDRLHIDAGLDEDNQNLPSNLANWRAALESALKPENLMLCQYPVISSKGTLLHYEAPAQLRIAQDWLPAGRFVPWAARLALMTQLDQLVFDNAVDTIVRDKLALSINLSLDAICNHEFQDHMIQRLREPGVKAGKLLLDINEFDAIHHQPEFRTFCLALKPLGCKIGLKHVGPNFSKIAELHDVGLDYLKVDTTVTRDIDKDPGNQAFLRGVCVVAHAIGVKAIAGGVSSQAEIDCLASLGIDGMTGPGIKLD